MLTDRARHGRAVDAALVASAERLQCGGGLGRVEVGSTQRQRGGVGLIENDEVEAIPERDRSNKRIN